MEPSLAERESLHVVPLLASVGGLREQEEKEPKER